MVRIMQERMSINREKERNKNKNKNKEVITREMEVQKIDKKDEF